MAITEWRHFQRFARMSRDDAALTAEYGALKEELTRRLLGVLYEQHPHLAGYVAYCSLSTPLTMNRYLGTTQGEVNGLAAGCARFSTRVQSLLRPRTAVKGLYLTGHDIALMGLPAGALAAATYTVFAVSPRAWLRAAPRLLLDTLHPGPISPRSLLAATASLARVGLLLLSLCAVFLVGLHLLGL